jgi:hypothetical protein
MTQVGSRISGERQGGNSPKVALLVREGLALGVRIPFCTVTPRTRHWATRTEHSHNQALS